MTGSLPPEVRLGNEIARQFGHLDDAAATAAISAHILKFWEPRMRIALRQRAQGDHATMDARLFAAASQI